eukprot:c20910_g1_i3 orf=89-556(+)
MWDWPLNCPKEKVMEEKLFQCFTIVPPSTLRQAIKQSGVWTSDSSHLISLFIMAANKALVLLALLVLAMGVACVTNAEEGAGRKLGGEKGEVKYGYNHGGGNYGHGGGGYSHGGGGYSHGGGGYSHGGGGHGGGGYGHGGGGYGHGGGGGHGPHA